MMKQSTLGVMRSKIKVDDDVAFGGLVETLFSTPSVD